MKPLWRLAFVLFTLSALQSQAQEDVSKEVPLPSRGFSIGLYGAIGGQHVLLSNRVEDPTFSKSAWYRRISEQSQSDQNVFVHFSGGGGSGIQVGGFHRIKKSLFAKISLEYITNESSVETNITSPGDKNIASYFQTRQQILASLERRTVFGAQSGSYGIWSYGLNLGWAHSSNSRIELSDQIEEMNLHYGPGFLIGPHGSFAYHLMDGFFLEAQLRYLYGRMYMQSHETRSAPGLDMEPHRLVRTLSITQVGCSLSLGYGF